MARNIEFQDLKNLSAVERMDQLIVEHKKETWQFTCKCGHVYTWCPNSQSYTVLKFVELKQPGMRKLLKGVCEHCGTIHWKPK